MTHPSLTQRFRTCIERGDFGALRDLYVDDALFDAHIPGWHFQLEGAAAIVGQLSGWYHPPGHFHDLQQEETASGDLLVRLEWCGREGSDEAFVGHQMQLWRLAGDRITEQAVFCAGGWDRQLIERMRVEAPLVRALSAPARDGEGTRAAVERFNAAFRRRDVDAVMALMTEDCVFEDTTPPDGRRHEGQANVRRCWEQLFAASPDAAFDTEELTVTGDRAVVRSCATAGRRTADTFGVWTSSACATARSPRSTPTSRADRTRSDAHPSRCQYARKGMKAVTVAVTVTCRRRCRPGSPAGAARSEGDR